MLSSFTWCLSYFLIQIQIVINLPLNTVLHSPTGFGMLGLSLHCFQGILKFLLWFLLYYILHSVACCSVSKNSQFFFFLPCFGLLISGLTLVFWENAWDDFIFFFLKKLLKLVLWPIWSVLEKFPCVGGRTCIFNICGMNGSVNVN